MAMQGTSVRLLTPQEKRVTYLPQDFVSSYDWLDRLSPPDREKFLEFGCGADVKPRFERIHQAFEFYAQSQPDSCAVIDAVGLQVSYRELNNQADMLAALLQSSGVCRGDSVCLFVRRSVEMVVGILACLKAGACYVPQDMLVCPSQQRDHVVATAKAAVILTTSEYLDAISAGEQQVIAIDRYLQQRPNVECLNPPINTEPCPQDTAVVIFTSGTTGKPNGVQVSHANLCNILLTAPGDMGIKPGKKVGQILNIAFDMAVWEVLGCLGNGGTLVIRGKSFQQVAERVDILIATPSILTSIDASHCHQLQAVAVAGEPCSRLLAETWGAFCDFYNSCGPTETTIVNTAEVYRPGDRYLSIGKPTPNNTVYILNDQLQPCRIGEVGEMWAGGDCVTKGYINNPALTAERYRDDPFLGNGRKMFRTRDLGRWLEDGTLEHLGRVDDQVKIRGFRVELDAVSAVLERTRNCARAVALKLDDRHLVAFVSPAGVDLNEAHRQVQQALPYYCEPLFILPLDALPKTIRGKIDKRQLMSLASEFYRANKMFDVEGAEV
ncbi:MAG: amino acid adenylation domain-containing protein [Amphritea sp.]